MICEVVQHLLARGERVLMVAPTHVAIDEVLRRVGKRPGVRAIRLSWDDSRIHEDVRHYAPGAIVNPIFDAIRAPNEKALADWANESERLTVLIGCLSTFLDARAHEKACLRATEEFENRFIKFQKQMSHEQPELLLQLKAAQEDRPIVEAKVRELTVSLQSADASLKVADSEAGIGTRLLSILGAGQLGAAKRNQRDVTKELSLAQQELEATQSLIRESSVALHRLASDQARYQKEKAETAGSYASAIEKRNSAEEALQEVFGANESAFDESWAKTTLERISERAKRLKHYPSLSEEFHGLLREQSNVGIDKDTIAKDVVSFANLYCCTTTGVAGSLEIKDATFDTLIVDEASRVTDSEFLIGAIRAKRWVLVGDENQLPPYVEQRDEHFIHALSALYRKEEKGITIDAAVSELGDLWLEDEEQHKFRNESVLRVAEEVECSGAWRRTYRDVFRNEYKNLGREVDDPTRALLEAMRISVVRSLFERVIESCEPESKVRLNEQRRMIEPIARIVSEPVYEGDYHSPSEDDLASIGVRPLTTRTFKTPITFLDTTALGKKGSDELIRNSFVNRSEASLVVEACRILEEEVSVDAKAPLTVSILAFYKAQARLIKEELSRHRFIKLRFSVIDAIDRIQGQESDVVFISFTRTNYARNVSPSFGQWLQDVRRLNVACTRAHRALFLVGQRELLGKLCSNGQAVGFYKNLASLFDQHPADMQVIKHLDVRQ